MRKKLIISLVACGLLAGCAENTGPKQASGQILGGIGGALIGSQFGKGHGQLVGVAVGALVGSQLGGALGQRMDAQDRQMASRTLHHTLESCPDNQVRTWRNPNSQHRGNIIVRSTQEYPEQNQVCRDYVHVVIIDGVQEKIHGRACRDIRDPKGQWFIKS